MKKIYKRIFKRNDSNEMYLYGFNEHKEKPSKELEIVPASKPHLRWNPARQEWVTYSAGRKNRIAFPPKEYCPLCPSGNLNFPTEIPFKDFEFAVFPNRWSSFNSHNESFSFDGINIQNSNGRCEVIVYSAPFLNQAIEQSVFYRGNKVKIHQKTDVWIEVSTFDGRKGWIQALDVRNLY